MIDNSLRFKHPAFTIVELLVVIVVIGILAAITIVSYGGISSKANITSLTSDLTNASRQIKMFQVDNSTYPTTIDCSIPDSTTNKCIKSSTGTTYTYQVNKTSSPQTFTLYETKTSSNTTYRITSDSQPQPIVSSTITTCPLNFILVPGSSTYSTNDFCVMKYEAKQVGSTTTPISQASGLPWVNITQTAAIANSQNVVVNGSACGSSCHLITEAEWLTIAQNVLSVPSNWSGGAVGNGAIYGGSSDSSPANALAADTNDNNGYIGTGNNDPSNQRRTLTLTNGEVIWDLAGNIYEWTTGQTTGNQPGIASGGYAWREWTSITTHGALSPDPFPSTTGFSGSSGWNSSRGIGQIYSSADDSTNPYVFLRGGGWGSGSISGVLTLYISNSSSSPNSYYGFRVSR